MKSVPGTFRQWVLNLYEEHKKEREEFKMRPLLLEEYWSNYKRWLKETYKNEKNF